MTADRSTPAAVPEFVGKHVTGLCAGSAFGAAIVDGAVVVWGDSSSGQLGVMSSAVAPTNLTLPNVGGFGNYTAVDVACSDNVLVVAALVGSQPQAFAFGGMFSTPKRIFARTAPPTQRFSVLAGVTMVGVLIDGAFYATAGSYDTSVGDLAFAPKTMSTTLHAVTPAPGGVPN